MAKTKTYEIQVAVRGEFRESGEVITYDFAQGEVIGKDADPRVLKRLVDGGIAVEKKEPK